MRDGVLVLETLLWPDEVRAPDFKFLDEDVDIRTQELKMAASLIDTMTEDFDPSLYKDTYREALEALVQAKIEGNEVVRPPGSAVPAGTPGGPADLTETLRASVEAAKANRTTKDADAAPPHAPQAAQARGQPQEDERVTTPVPHWPGRMLDLPSGEQVWLAEADAQPTAEWQGTRALRARDVRGGRPTGPTSWPSSRPTSTAWRLTCQDPGFSPPPKTRRGYSVSAACGHRDPR